MFFIFGIDTKEEYLNFSDLRVCKVCGSYGRYEAFVRYQAFSLFFIPIFKWGRRYFLRSTCCSSVFEIDQSLGRNLEAGRISEISDSDLHLVASSYRRTKTCPSCSYQADPSFDYCPRCGEKL